MHLQTTPCWHLKDNWAQFYNNIKYFYAKKKWFNILILFSNNCRSHLITPPLLCCLNIRGSIFLQLFIKEDEKSLYWKCKVTQSIMMIFIFLHHIMCIIMKRDADVPFDCVLVDLSHAFTYTKVTVISLSK